MILTFKEIYKYQGMNFTSNNRNAFFEFKDKTNEQIARERKFFDDRQKSCQAS